MTHLHPWFFERPLAHRGYHDVASGRPENSRAAFVAAIEAGFGIELDLQLSSDGQAMVFHDYHLGRLTGEVGAVAPRSAAELGRIQLTGGAEGIPTLVDVLDLVNGRTPLLIELKDQDGALGRNIGLLETATAEALANYQGPVAVMSFNPHSVALLAELLPDVARGLTTCGFTQEDWPLVPQATRERLKDIPDYDRIGCEFISHEVIDLQNQRVIDLKAAGAAVFCWTIRSVRQEAEARLSVDNITFEGYPAAIGG